MKKPIYYLSFALTIITFSEITIAQKIENLHFEQVEKRIEVYYDFINTIADQTYEVQIFCSNDGGKTFGHPLEKVSGDVGNNQTGGLGKRIIWDVLKEREDLVGNIFFEIHAKSTAEVQENLGMDESDGEPFVLVDEFPKFPGGEVGLSNFIQNNIQYPEAAKRRNIQGKVIVRFVVTSKGTINRISILKGVDPDLDKEAIRVTQILPTFTPGKQGGKAVPVWYMIPVTFKLN